LQSILIQSEINTRDALIAELWEYGTVGIIEDSHTVRAFFKSDFTLSQIVNQLSCPVLELRQETDLVAAETSDVYQNDDPIYAGRHFFIVSSWMNHPTPPDRYRLTIDANDAFGSGRHESTQLAITALEEHLSPNAIVLDVGCGSGILAAVAQKLGAGQTFACDTHMGALDSARKHSPDSHFFAGSVDALAPSVADVVIVNIGAAVIDLLADELYRITKPTGLLILTGFTNDRAPAKIHPEKVFQLNDWLCWLCRPKNVELSQNRPQATLQPFPAQWW
jgi:ribosomal protein L11 methyltransferase